MSSRIDAIKARGTLKVGVLGELLWLIENTSGSGEPFSGPSWLLANEYAKRLGVKLETVKEEDLPEELKKLKAEDRQAYVDAKCAQREKIQADIQKLNQERQKFISDKVKDSGEKSLDDAIASAVREQAAKRQIEFKD